VAEAVGRERQAGGRPSKEGKVEPLEGIPWGPGSRLLRRLGEKGREGHEEGRCFFKDPAEGNLGGAEAQEGTGPALTRKGWESRWCRWPGERKPLKRRCQAARSGKKAQERKVRGKPRTGHRAGTRP
jgi:hypothetical protein